MKEIRFKINENLHDKFKLLIESNRLNFQNFFEDIIKDYIFDNLELLEIRKQNKED